MKKTTLTIAGLLMILLHGYAQFADLGTGSLKDKVWWLNWNGLVMQNGASKTFATVDGLVLTATFSNVMGQVAQPHVMTTLPEAVLHTLYDFSDPSVQPALYSGVSVGSTGFTISFTATRGGAAVPFTLVAADAAASMSGETNSLVTTGAGWQAIDLFRNSSQTNDPLTGCNTSSVTITETQESVTQPIGQSPVVATDAPASGQLKISVSLDRHGAASSMGLVFGIFAPADWGDLPATYGYAVHQLTYNRVNACNYMPPLPSLVQDVRLKIGYVAADADANHSSDDNVAGADEDAIAVFPVYDRSGTYTIRLPVGNTTRADAWLSGWFDFNQDGVFTTGESVIAKVAANAPGVTLQWTGIPAALSASGNFAFRFRLSSDKAAITSASSIAPDGEAEDYLTPIQSTPAPAVTFDMPDTICQNEPMQISNVSGSASSYYWRFCETNYALPLPSANIMFSTGDLEQPSFVDYASVNNNYYGFLISRFPAGLKRLDFGNSLLNIPAIVNLGNVGGIFHDYTSGELQVVQNEGKWYIIIVGGDGVSSTPGIFIINLGADITNPSPVVTSWGNIGNLSSPAGLKLLKEGNNWYGLTVNTGNNTMTRFSFGSSFDNAPTATNLGNIGGLAAPVGLCVVRDGTVCSVFITNSAVNASITRLDFGASLLNTPTGVNLGNVGGKLLKPVDMIFIRSCHQIAAWVLNGTTAFGYSVLSLDFNNDLFSVPTVALSIDNTKEVNGAYAFSTMFRVDGDLYSFVPDSTGLLSRLKWAACTYASISGSPQQTPPPATYPAPGTYTVSLLIDEGLSTQQNFCKTLTVLPAVERVPVKDTAICADTVHLTSRFTPPGTWSDGSTDRTFIVRQSGIYWVQAPPGVCPVRDSFVYVLHAKPDLRLTRDTLICKGGSVPLTASGLVNYTWYPADGLSDANIATPIAQPADTIWYHVRGTDVNHCTAEDSVLVDVKEKASFSLSPLTAAICEGETMVLTADGGDTYKWLAPFNQQAGTGASVQVSPATATTYKVVAYDKTCAVSDTLTSQITVKELPVITLTKSNDIDCLVGEAHLTVSGANQYEWYPSGTLTGADSYNPVARTDSTTLYHVKATGANGCVAEGSIQVQVFKNSNVNSYPVASAFTPNGDGLNDCFGITKWGYVKNLQMAVFNRWGQQVFATSHPGDCWDGRYHGIDQPPGAFVYTIKAETLCGTVVKKGTLVLLR